MASLSARMIRSWVLTAAWAGRRKGRADTARPVRFAPAGALGLLTYPYSKNLR